MVEEEERFGSVLGERVETVLKGGDSIGVGRGQVVLLERVFREIVEFDFGGQQGEPEELLVALPPRAAERLDVRFDVGAAEALPYPDESFDTVMSMFGVMFSARPERALAELVRVTRRGGRIALANWTPAGFVGSMLRAHRAFVPPPPGSASVLAWGDPKEMSRLLGPHAGRFRAVRFVPRTIEMAFPLPPGGVVGLFREFYGPSVKTFEALDSQRRTALETELLRLWTDATRAPEGSTAIDAEYLEVQIDIR